MIFNLVEAAQEFLSEIVPLGQSNESVSFATSVVPEFQINFNFLFYLYLNYSV